MIDWDRLQNNLYSRNKVIRKSLDLCAQLYGKAVRRRLLKYYRSRNLRKRVPAKVISVGNIVAGGTGKTPMVRWLCKHFSDRGVSCAVVSRGYGRKRSKNDVTILNKSAHSRSWLDVGDEPYMLCRQLPDTPVLVGKNRYKCALEAIRHFGSRIIVMDDGFQHLSLERDLDLVLLDCERPFDNGHLIPLGKLREPISHLVRADVFILTRVPSARAEQNIRSFLNFVFPDIPVYGCFPRPVAVKQCLSEKRDPPEFLRNRDVLAFSGIGNPSSFAATLESCGARVRKALNFPDHYSYSAKDVNNILKEAKRAGVEAIITTEKDEIRLPSKIEIVKQFYCLVIEVQFTDEAEFCEWLDGRIGI